MGRVLRPHWHNCLIFGSFAASDFGTASSSGITKAYTRSALPKYMGRKKWITVGGRYSNFVLWNAYETEMRTVQLRSTEPSSPLSDMQKTGLCQQMLVKERWLLQALQPLE